MTTAQGTAVPGRKFDPDGKPIDGADLPVKYESELMDIPLAEDDIYEDAGDLEFAEASRNLFLTRIPKYLWKYWSTLDNEQEIRLGTVRVEGTIEKPESLSLMLSLDIAKKAMLPAEYVLQMTNAQPTNTFVFNEKDLPGYTASRKGGFKTSGGDVPLALARTKTGGQDPTGIDKNRRYRGRRGIPKQTAIAGRIKKELNCLPVDNTDYKRIMETRAREAGKKTRPRTEYQPGLVAATGGTTMVPGAGLGFTSFIKTKNKKGEKSQKMKAARIAQNELLDLIYDCFKQYEYWPFRSLKERLQQPDAYLKETLEMVAHLVRSGTFANNWQLKPEAKGGAYEAYEQAKDEKAPDDGLDEGSDSEGEDDENEEEMEDVLPI
ncbi:MAG: hypothetical protein Q9191_005581 [Dirinaria sp. TL-2023a]